MKRGRVKDIIIGILIIIIFLLGGVIVYNYKFNNNGSIYGKVGNEVNDKQDNVDNNINLADFEKIIDDELYILFGYKSLSELSNQRKLTLVFNLLESEYAYSSNDVSSYLGSVSREKVEELFNGTVLGSLGIKHEDIDVYEVNDYFYNRNFNYMMSKRNLFRPGNLAKKVVDYSQDGNRYTVDVKYLFTNNADNGDRGQFAYGSYVFGNEDKKIVEVYRYNNNFEFEILVPDLQKYLDDNYDVIKDKLDTYRYVFEVNNDGVKLVDFSVVNL